MPQAIGSGTISFGLVTIPVKVFSATKSSEQISFNLLHGKCNSRLRQQYVCVNDDEIVSRDEMVKGYEFAKGQYVVFSDDELKALEMKSTQTIEIVEFVPSEKVDPIYFDKAYYLGPDKHGSRAYQILGKAMEETGRWAIARYTARGKQYLVALRPVEGGLVMQQLRYSEEIRSIDEIPVDADAEIKEQELKLAVMLAESVSADEFHPESYRDEVRDRVRELIQKKVEGEEVSFAPVEEPKAKVIDLMEALKASLADGGGRSGSKKVAAKTARKPAKRATPKSAAKKGKAASGGRRSKS